MTTSDARREFPLLATCTYLNSNSMGATPRGARAAAEAYYDVLFRWRDAAFEELWASATAYADEVAELMGAPPGSIALDVNVSTLLGRILSAFDFRARPRAVTSDLEFPSASFLLGAFARYGCERVVVPSRDGVSIDVERMVESVDERTSVVVVSHATFTTGALVDLAPIARRAREVGAVLVVDAYQTLGVVPVDVRSLGVDVLLGGAHKWLCGAFDCAFAYVRPEVLARLEPAATGWMAGDAAMSFRPSASYATGPRRLAAGSPAPLPPIASREGLRLVRAAGVDRIREVSLARTSRVIDRADAAGLEVVTPRAPERRGGVVVLRFDGAAEVVRDLERDGFVCSHRDGARIAPHFYNTDDEIERFMDALVARARKRTS